MMQSLGNSAPGHILADASGAPKFRQNRAAVHAPTSAPLPAGSSVALHSTAPAAGAAAVSGLGAPCSALDQLPIPAASAPLPAMLPEHTDSEAKAALPSAGAPQILRADNLRSAHAPATPRPLAEAPAQGHLLLAATSGTAFPTSVPVRALAPVPGYPGGQAAHALAADDLVVGAPDMAQNALQPPAMSPMPAPVTATLPPCGGPAGRPPGEMHAAQHETPKICGDPTLMLRD